MREQRTNAVPYAAAGRRRRRVGVLDLLHDSTPRGFDRIYTAHFRRQFVSITPQAVSVWCRELGHEVFYATYFGQAPPEGLLPDDLDVVFVAAYTKAGPLAYALSKIFRSRGAVTVIGGPHARSFPEDCLRFFDFAVHDCDRTLVDDILRGRFDAPAELSSGRPLTELPTVEERMPELRVSSLGDEGSAGLWSAVPVLASVGCPYTCDFCVDWSNDYIRLPMDRLEADLRYLSEHYPKAVVGYHDPNFGVKFDDTLDVIERVPEGRRNPYVMESSLAILKESRLERLRRTRCAYVAPGVESWSDYSGKAGAGARAGRDKLERIVAHFELLGRYVEGFQANFVFGTDVDRGDDPLRLTQEFVRRLPFVWAGVNIPTPFGGTPLYEQLRAQDRVLEQMPFVFYYNPYLTFVPAHYDPVEYYGLLIELFRTMTAPASWLRRFTNGKHYLVKFIHSVQAFGALAELGEFRRLRRKLRRDRAFRAFHEGRSRTLPELYHRLFERRMGAYAELLSREERIPRLGSGASAAARRAARRAEPEESRAGLVSLGGRTLALEG